MSDNTVMLSKSKPDGVQQLLPMDDSPKAAKSFTDSQLELFDCRHGIMILHLLTALMFAPSLVAWLQVCHSLVNHNNSEISRSCVLGKFLSPLCDPYVFIICSNK